MKKLFIGICNSQETVSSLFFWSFAALNRPISTTTYRATHPWDVVRNNHLIHRFLKSDCDCFVKMDVDQMYPHDYFDKMLPLLETHDVIGPMIYDRHMSSGFMPLCFEEDANEPFANRGPAFDRTTGIQQLPYLHTNCFYNRRVLEAVPPPWYEAELSEDGLKRANHVDFTFMRKITKAGFKIFINFDVVVAHIASVPVTRAVHNQWNYASKQIENARRAALAKASS